MLAQLQKVTWCSRYRRALRGKDYLSRSTKESVLFEANSKTGLFTMISTVQWGHKYGAAEWEGSDPCFDDHECAKSRWLTNFVSRGLAVAVGLCNWWWHSAWDFLLLAA